MAIDYNQRYPDQTDTDSNYPQGKARNKTTPASTDGFPFEEDYINDQLGFFQALLKESGITPSGNADTANNSDYLDALKRIGKDSSTVVNEDGTTVQENISLNAFKNVAEMESFDYTNVPEGTRVYWQGYYEQSDGGSNWGVVKYGAHTEDRGSIFSIDSTTYIEANHTSKKGNIRKFGAKGDGVNNDTFRIRATFDYGFDVVYIPNGTYRVTDTIYVTSAIEGEGTYKSGYNATIFMDSPFAKNILEGVGEDFDLKDISGIAITGEDDRIHTAIYGKGYRIQLNNIRIRKVDIGIDISGVYIYNNYLDIAQARIGYYPSTLKRDSPILGSTMYFFSHCVMNYTGTGFLLENRYGGEGNSEDLLLLSFQNCGFEQNDYGIRLRERAWHTTITNSWFEANSEYGLDVESQFTELCEINNRHESNSEVNIQTERYSSLRGTGVNAPSVTTDVITNKSNYVLDESIPSGQVIAHAKTLSDAESSTEIFRVGRSAYAAGTESSMIALTPNRGDSNFPTGGYVKSYRPTTASGSGTYLSLGILKRNTSGATLEENLKLSTQGLTGFNIGEDLPDNTVSVGGNVAPHNDSSGSVGTATKRWSVIYASSDTISTSDEREKTFLDISETETLVAKELKGLIRKFKFNSSIEEKGEDARIHYGVNAQEVKATFEKHGLDAMEYGLLCFDEWEGGDRYGIRYNELICFIISSL